jgi:trehalose synthase
LVESKSIVQYADIIGQDSVNEILEIAENLKDTSLTHINSTKIGGGVAEILQNLIPLASSIGLDMRWQVMKGAPEFFDVTKSFHNALQGMDLSLTESMKDIYFKYNREFADTTDLDSDLLVVHDPQPAPLIEMLKDSKQILWRCHIDLTNAHLTYWNFIKQIITKYDALIFSLDKYVHKDVSGKKIYLVPPSIDPLSDKNKSLPPETIHKTLQKFDIDPEKPIISQISRFDYWKDPLGVIESYKLVKMKVPDSQLILIGNMANDDPEGQEWFEKTSRKAEEVEDVHMLLNLDDLEVNSFQRASDVVIQKSIREGFGLTVTEALWKGTPVVGTKVGGIPLQVIDGLTGFLVSDIREAADRIVQLLKKRDLAKVLGLQGREHIKKNFLITRHLKDYMEIQLEMIKSKSQN